LDPKSLNQFIKIIISNLTDGPDIVDNLEIPYGHSTGQYWAVLGSTGQYWAVLDSTGQY